MNHRIRNTLLAAALLAPALAQAEGSISIAQQFGIGYLILDVVKEQKLIEKHGKAEGLDIEVDWRTISGATAMNEAQLAEVTAVVHPVVRTHPETGRKGLFVNENFTTHILDIPEDESRQILAELYAHSARPEFIHRHVWQPHDMVFWDNRALIHLATGCPSHLRRRMHRTTIQGDVPF